MVIISKRSPSSLEWANEAARHAPNVWAHQRAMLWWNKLSAIDYETAKMAMARGPKDWRWIATWPEAVAATLNDLHPEVFSDTTGKTMLRFLESEAGAPYRVKDRKKGP